MDSSIAFAVTIWLGFAIPGAVALSYRLGSVDRHHLVLFGLGTLLGVSWEAGLVGVQRLVPAADLFRLFVELPVGPWLHALSHSFWDGLLFLIGVGLVEQLRPAPHFRGFDWREALVLVAWGQLQSLAIEVTAVVARVWAYEVHAWNPALFWVSDRPVTVLPQAIWLLAALAFYACCLRVTRNTNGHVGTG